MISSRSRYVSAVVKKMKVSATDIRQTILYTPPSQRSVRYSSHLWRIDDRIDTLADDLFGDPTRWWVIARVNPEILDWRSLAPGTVIRIPSG